MFSVCHAATSVPAMLLLRVTTSLYLHQHQHLDVFLSFLNIRDVGKGLIFFKLFLPFLQIRNVWLAANERVQNACVNK